MTTTKKWVDQSSLSLDHGSGHFLSNFLILFFHFWVFSSLVIIFLFFVDKSLRLYEVASAIIEAVIILIVSGSTIYQQIQQLGFV